MKKIAAVLIVVLFSSNVAFAGPLKEAIAKAQVPPPARENKLLWPGLSVLGAGMAVALYGFTHTTGASISTNTSGTSINVEEKKSTGIGFAGLAIAGAGAFLIYKGANDAKKLPSIAVGPRSISYSVRF